MRFGKVLLLLAFCTYALPVAAGATRFVPLTVGVHNGEGEAFATLSAIRDIRDGSIGCELFDGFRTIFPTGGCRATDRFANSIGGCSVFPNSPTRQAFEKGIRAINTASFILFRWNLTTLECTDLAVINGSQFLRGESPSIGPTGGTAIREGFAAGTLRFSRFNDNNVEFISCEIWVSGGVGCSARDAEGNTAECKTTEAANPLFAERVRAIDSASRVEFHFDPATGACLSMHLGKSSGRLP
jgi:hypothetical protein